MSDASLHDALSLESLVAEVADEFLERQKRGEQPVVEEYAARHPQHAAVIGEVLAALRVVGLSGVCGTLVPELPAASDEPMLGELGDFRLVREIGRGGMGVVYEAIQISLGRRVALKVLPFASTLDAKQRQRFKNESQAAAHLHHTNIVPVYATGCERGVHYYAMQLIDGQTLAAVIAELRQAAEPRSIASRDDRKPAVPHAPSSDHRGPVDTRPVAVFSTLRSTKEAAYFRTVAQWGIQAAEALEHAHQFGVVHRDIKPANLLVDTKGNLWITDFGLARLQNEASLTASGDLVGTLRYMSPEQALGHPTAVGPRTDIYSLGATLYELLSLCPVFDGRDRQELLRRIAAEEPRPPRRLNAAVPLELEIIVQKALEKDAEGRYTTAQELADDLRRFLEDRPIRARRPSRLEQARRWARRHRPVVWSATAALLVALTVVAGSIGWVVRDRAARQARVVADAQVALEIAHEARKEGKWPQAEAAARRAQALLQDGAVEPALAERVQSLLRELAAEEADGRLVARLEELRLLQAEVKGDRFDLERALPDYRQAFGGYGLHTDVQTPEEAAALLQRRPPAVRAPLMAALDHWLILARFMKAPEAEWLERVLAAADADAWRQQVRAARAQGDRPALEQLARDVDVAAQPPEALFLLNLSLRQRGAKEAAAALLRRAQQAFPGDFWINHDLGMALQECQPPQVEEAVRFLTAAAALRPQSPGVRLNLGMALWRNGRLDDAMAAFRQTVALKRDYAMAQQYLGLVLIAKGRHDEAAAAFRQVVELKPDFAPAQFNLGVCFARMGRLDEAITAYHRAIELKADLAEAHCNLGVALMHRGEFAQALGPLRLGHELGSQRPDWRYLSAAWVTQCERYLELDGRVFAVLQGELQPASAVERNDYAQLCYYKKLNAASARLRAAAFAANPKLAEDLKASHRYGGACAAALAGCGQGADAEQLDDADRVRWRRQALEWLRADLQANAKLLETGKPADHPVVQNRLRHWQHDPDLAGVRDPAAVARLPAGEREMYQQLWAEVEAVLALSEHPIARP